MKEGIHPVTRRYGNDYTEYVDNLETELIEVLGKDEFILSLTKAIPYSEKAKLYEAIARDWDI